MVDNQDDEVSPASIVFKQNVTWDREKIASNCEIEDDETLVYNTNSTFRWCRSEQLFTSGSHRLSICYSI